MIPLLGHKHSITSKEATTEHICWLCHRHVSSHLRASSCTLCQLGLLLAASCRLFAINAGCVRRSPPNTMEKSGSMTAKQDQAQASASQFPAHNRATSSTYHCLTLCCKQSNSATVAWMQAVSTAPCCTDCMGLPAPPTAAAGSHKQKSSTCCAYTLTSIAQTTNGPQDDKQNVQSISAPGVTRAQTQMSGRCI